MSRRSSRKVEASVLEAHATNVVSSPSTTPKKGRKVVKVEDDAVIVTTKLTKSPKVPEVKTKTNAEADTSLTKVTKITSAKEELEAEVKQGSKPKKALAKRKAKAEEEDDDGEEKEVVTKKKRKTKEEKEAENVPLAARTAIATLEMSMHIGAHVSAAKGVQNSVTNALHIGGNAFAVFLKSQRKWESPPLSSESRDQFRAFCEEHKFDAAKHVLPHGSYLVNLAQKEAAAATKAYDCFLDDLQRCEQLGIKLYNFHPGNTGKFPRPEAIGRIAAQLNKAHKATSTVVTVLENMAGSGNVIGSTWEDLRDIIALVDDKARVGVCIDTCHTHAAGYDLRSPEAFKKTMNDFDNIVGLSYLKALHLNDSKAPFASHRDLHANIGTGFLGLRAFHNVVNFAPFQGLPMVLETPIDEGPDRKGEEDKGVWAKEIKLLEGLIGADPGSESFKADEERLQNAGTEERKKYQAQADKRQNDLDKKKQKTLDGMFKAVPKGKKKSAAESDAADSGASDSGCNH